MSNNEIKTNAEIYREQRKERLAKTAKKKHSAKKDKAIRVTLKVLCIVIVVLLVGYGAANLLVKSLYVPQKTLTAAKYNDQKITVAQFNYYYMLVYNNMYSQAYQVEQSYASYYGAGVGAQLTGFDYTADPAKQDYTADDEDDNKIATWADYFKSEASAAAFTNMTLYNEAMSDEAKEKGFEITADKQDEINKSIDETVSSLKETADKNDYSLDNYISLACGEGLTEKTYREYLLHDQIASEYISWYQENASDTLTEDNIVKYYNENLGKYAKVSARVFSIAYTSDTTTTTAAADSKDPVYTQKQAKARANAFKAAVTSEASFIALTKEYCLPSQEESYKDDSASLLIKDMTKDNITSKNEDIANWLYDSKRAVGDTTVIEDTKNSVYFIVYAVTLPTKDTSPANVSVRHILFQAATTTTDADGKSVDLDEATIAKNLAAAKKKAEAALKEWKAGDATEASFSALATEKSEDTGSTENGGLYDDVNSASSYVDEFKSWALAPHKAGDTAIIKTTYGYHVMYFVSAEKEQKWHSDVKSDIASTSTTDYQTKIYDSIKADVKENASIIDYFCGRVQDKISRNMAQSASNS